MKIPFYYYIVNGGLAHRAIYYPVAKEFSEFTDEIYAADYIVSRNPIFDLSEDTARRIILDEFASLQITRLDGAPISEVHLAFEMNGSKNTHTASWIGASATTQLVVAEAGSFMLSSPTSNAATLLIELDSGSQVHITSIKFDTDTLTNWPWQQGVQLELVTSHGTSRSVEISNDLLGEGLPFDINVFDDDGYTVLAEAVK
jgi:hypothetical protein